jgi:hypothetical protein
MRFLHTLFAAVWRSIIINDHVLKRLILNLVNTILPTPIVAKLRQLNIREVETLLSIIATPTGLLSIAQVLGISSEKLKTLAAQMSEQNLELANVKATTGPFHPMGHRPPKKSVQPKSERST